MQVDVAALFDRNVTASFKDSTPPTEEAVKSIVLRIEVGDDSIGLFLTPEKLDRFMHYLYSDWLQFRSKAWQDEVDMMEASEEPLYACGQNCAGFCTCALVPAMEADCGS